MNEIETKYQQLGGPTGFLGTALNEETLCPDGVGRYRSFQNGSIHWHPSTGAFETHGAIRDQWGQQGWERGQLGYPKSDERTVSESELKGLIRPEEFEFVRLDSYNRCSEFQGGRIYFWSADNYHHFLTVITTDGKRRDEAYGNHNGYYVCGECGKRALRLDPYQGSNCSSCGYESYL
jgi:LGFP repeat